MVSKVLIEKKAIRFLNNLETEHRERVKVAYVFSYLFQKLQRWSMK